MSTSESQRSFAVSVYFTVKPDHMQAFRTRMLQQAADSLALEPQCRQFEVGVCEDRPDTIFLYEAYDDADAFDAHLASAHFRAFEADVADMIVSRRIEKWQLEDLSR